MEAAIKIIDLKKSYGSVLAVAGVNYHVNRGEMFGLIGPDGAGKTTTIRMLVGLLVPESGSAEVLGFDLLKQKKSDKKRNRLSFAKIFALW